MRKILITLSLLLSVFSFAFSQENMVPEDVVNGLERGNVSLIVKHLNSNVELVVENKNDVYSKQQATNIINDFFSKRKIEQFKVLHKGQKENSGFIIGTLKTNITDYRVYLLTRKSDGRFTIQQIRIEQLNSN